MSLTSVTDLLPSEGNLVRISFPTGMSTAMITFISPDVSAGAASNRVENNKDNEDYYKNNGDLLPIFFPRSQNTCLACAATIAKLVLIIAPKPTVGVGAACRRSCGSSPSGGVDICEIASRRWLATSRLNRR